MRNSYDTYLLHKRALNKCISAFAIETSHLQNLQNLQKNTLYAQENNMSELYDISIKGVEMVLNNKLYSLLQVNSPFSIYTEKVAPVS